ncbi:MAG: hypothetical protein B6245_16080 [Desulfobacteraceae bacterium 4572_88]|nr:MAG: hypothetical protein B6245_16080 [Desulfobacteraceae bacterium 4572_88]
MQSNPFSDRKILFVMTIDTEEEWDWSGDFPERDFSVQNTRNIPKFQEFCNNLGVKPTYFVDYAIISDPASAECLKVPFQRGKCEIGAHLHPWCNPPVEETVNQENSYIVNLPPELVKRKLINLTKKIEEAIGERPRSFRSGRWGMNEEILKLLADEGYTTDSCVFPFYADSTFSYYGAPDTPYWPDFENLKTRGTQRDIFEIPVSSGFNFKNFELSDKIHQFLSSDPWRHFRMIGILWRLGLFKKLQLSPELTNSSDMISCIQACLRRGHRIIHMFFHSSSLLQGGSPYVSNEADETRFYKSIEDVVHYMKANTNVTFCTLSEAQTRYLEL